MAQTRPKVVVIGGGFGGMGSVEALAKYDVDTLLIDQKVYNTFQPLLYQVATGGLNPGDVTYSLRAFCSRFPNARFRHGAVARIDTTAKVITLQGGATVDYDYLIIATGVVANFFGIPGVEEHAFTIYTRGASLVTRDHLFSRLEYLATPGSGEHPVNIVVVGGGPTGVEMAGTLAEMAHLAIPYAYPEVDPKRMHVILIEMGDEVLGPFNQRLKDYARKTLERKGVELRLGTAVTKITETECHLSSGEILKSKLVVWGAGVAPRFEVKNWGLPLGRGDRIVIEPDCRVKGFKDVFAVGDVAVHEGDEALPQLAQPALQEGQHSAKMIAKLMAGEPTTPFKYFDKGIMATIGRHAAIAETPQGMKMTGIPAWLAWIALHILVLLSKRNRFSVMTNLAARYFAYPRNVNVIVGDTLRPENIDAQREEMARLETESQSESEASPAEEQAAEDEKQGPVDSPSLDKTT